MVTFIGVKVVGGRMFRMFIFWSWLLSSISLATPSASTRVTGCLIFASSWISSRRSAMKQPIKKVSSRHPPCEKASQRLLGKQLCSSLVVSGASDGSSYSVGPKRWRIALVSFGQVDGHRCHCSVILSRWNDASWTCWSIGTHLKSKYCSTL